MFLRLSNAFLFAVFIAGLANGGGDVPLPDGQGGCKKDNDCDKYPPHVVSAEGVCCDDPNKCPLKCPVI